MVKVVRSSRSQPAPVVVAPKPRSGWLWALLLFGGALVAAFLAYAPALGGDFVFDDRGLPMFFTNAAALPLRAWIGVRPLLMATFYANFQLSGLDPGPYHAFNVVLHAGCAVLIFFAIRRLLEWAGTDVGKRTGLAAFGAALFLLHPVQTEAVSYVASRSENLSVLFFLGAFNLFLYRKKVAIDFKTSAFVLVLYVCAMSCKEHTAMLPAVLLLTDYFFNPGFSWAGVRNNWKLYVPVAIAGAGGLYYFSTYIVAGSNLGFGMRGLTWYDYLLTEFRAIFVYLRLFLLPYGQSVDYNFPVSHHLLEYGSVFYGIALLGAIAAAVYFRKRYPIASYGFLTFLLLLAPTSSILPIKDPLAERRLYLPFIGLALMACEAALRIEWKRNRLYAVLTGVCVVLAVLTFNRNQKWTGMEALWEDAVSKDPNNTRALMGLADAYALRGRCGEAIPYFQRAEKLDPSDYRNTYNLASAYDCVNQEDAAMAGYRKALAIKPSAEAWAHLAMIQMKQRQFDDAYRSLAQGGKTDPSYLLSYTYTGILDLAFSRFDTAAAQFRHVLSVDPTNDLALRGLDRAQKHERQF